MFSCTLSITASRPSRRAIVSSVRLVAESRPAPRVLGELLVVQALGEGVLIVAEALLHLALAGAEGVGQPRHPGVRLRPLAAPAAQRQGDGRGERDGEDGRQGHGNDRGVLHRRRLTSRTGRHT